MLSCVVVAHQGVITEWLYHPVSILQKTDIQLSKPFALVLPWWSWRKVGYSPTEESQISPSLLFPCQGLTEIKQEAAGDAQLPSLSSYPANPQEF